ncbi:hypothetical protein J1N35_036006 [Gossypium stocksii]|uniref:Uncharacterized protein n=1 Tax=Gossypium stocksii TaxID=47602 RepID=A0A9D3UV87_9ROSI|nr:hypothetical protein J1N35_036006 [Gossypium stocksii]
MNQEAKGFSSHGTVIGIVGAVEFWSVRVCVNIESKLGVYPKQQKTGFDKS